MRCICFLLSALPLFADGLPTAQPKPPVAAQPTPREVAWRVLSGVHLAVGKAQAAVQPYVMLHLAENTVEFNRKLALIEFRDAFADTRILETTYRVPLQAQIVSAAAPIDIPTAIELVRTMRPEPNQRRARESWDHSVLAIDAQLLGSNRANEAIDLIKLVSLPGVFPNDAASNIITTLSPKDDRRLSVFGYAATCYRQFPFPGFTTLLVDHWQEMPLNLVVLAADAVADDGSHASHAELRQVLPILRAVDAPRAARLLNERPEIEEPEKEPRPISTHVDPDDDRQMQRASKLAQEYPMRALDEVASIRDPELREQWILQIARQAFQSGGDANVASRALYMLQQLPAESQGELSGKLGELAAYAGQYQLAEQWVDTSFEVAARVLEADLNTKSDCGANPAPRDWWPSTAAYRSAIHGSVALFHTGAERFLTRMQHDPDLYLLMSVEFARALLGSGTTAAPQITCRAAVALAKEAAQ